MFDDKRASQYSDKTPEARGADNGGKDADQDHGEDKVLDKDGTGEEVDETKYPRSLALFILITGIALSVFLISLDRTIITTVSSSKTQ